jgi:hypothetical protein
MNKLDMLSSFRRQFCDTFSNTNAAREFQKVIPPVFSNPVTKKGRITPYPTALHNSKSIPEFSIKKNRPWTK